MLQYKLPHHFLLLSAWLILSLFGVKGQTPEAEWTAFRDAFPYHLQTIAISEPNAEGMRTLIIAEPPPHVTVESIRKIRPGWFSDIKVMKHPIGYDGLVKDIVVAVPANDPEMRLLISDLSRLLFHTSYKSHALQLPYQRQVQPEELDLQISAEEIHTWLSRPESRFSSILGLPEFSLEQIRAQDATGIFFSEDPGLVLWWMPRGIDLEDSRGVIRQFAIDSDLIVGAQIFSEGLLIIARERIVPLDMLPPLRTETIVLLASVDTSELGQSYERNYILAGRYDIQRDWAPIYLSPELRDTEYGSLLNITDQMLKGWSNNGQTRYVNFKYPDPPEWPFSKPLPLALGVDEVTYNWNTSGAGYAIEGSGVKTYALNRTGALPVSYIPGGDAAALEDTNAAQIEAVRSAEDRAYEYFAGRHDPNLVRVVQYAALYQIFQYAPIAETRWVETHSQPETILNGLLRDLLHQIRDASPAELTAIQHRIEQSYKAMFTADELSPAEISQIGGVVDTSLQILQADLQTMDPEQFELLLQILSVSKNLSPAQLIVLSIYLDDPTIYTAISTAQLVLPYYASAQKLHQRYVTEAREVSQAGWIRTPVVVLSSVSGDIADAMGGHNLSARISPFKLDATVARGTPLVKDGIIHVNPADAAKISSVVRTAGKNLSDPALLARRLQHELRFVAPRPPRPMQVALGHKMPPPGGPRSPRGGMFASESGEGAGGFRSLWKPSEQAAPKALVSDLRSAQAAGEPCIMIERTDGGVYHVLYNSRQSPLKAYTPEDATDLVVSLMETQKHSKGSMQIYTSGLNEAEAKHLVYAARVRAANAGLNGRIVGKVRTRPLPIRELNRRLISNYNYQAAQVEAIPSQSNRVLQFKITVPPHQTGAPLTVTSRVEFIRQVAVEKLKAAKERMLLRLRSLLKRERSDTEKLRIFDDIDHELRTLEQEIGVGIKDLESKFKTELGDVGIVRKTPAAKPGTGRAG